MIRSTKFGDGKLYEIQPGDGTKYIIAVHPVTPAMGMIIGGCKEDMHALVLSIQPARKAYPFVIGVPQDVRYVYEKIGGDGYTAELIAHLMPLLTSMADEAEILESAQDWIEP